jgi:hypothetical protein
MIHRVLHVQCQAHGYGKAAIQGLSGSLDHDPACNDNAISLSGDPLFPDFHYVDNIQIIVQNPTDPNHIGPYWDGMPNNSDNGNTIGYIVVDGGGGDLPYCRPADFTIEWDALECTCTPVLSVTPSNQSASSYTLTVSAAGGDCASSPLNPIWTPAPDSGQGTASAVYTGLAYNMVHQIGFAAIDSAGCTGTASVDFEIDGPDIPGPNPPSCG